MTDRWGTGRIEAFSDGIFAIAITLLFLEISVPARDLYVVVVLLAFLAPTVAAFGYLALAVVAVCRTPGDSPAASAPA